MTERPEQPTQADEESRSRRTLNITIDGTTIWAVIGAILATLLVLWMFDRASHLLGLVAFSFFLSLALQPLVMKMLNRWPNMKRGAAVGIIYLLGIVIFILMIVVLIPAIATLGRAIGESGAQWVQDLTTWLNDTFGLNIGDGGFDQDEATSFEEDLGEWARGAAEGLLDVATSGISAIFDIATIAMFTFYFTADAPRLQRTILQFFTPDEQYRIGWTWDQAIVQTGGYFYSRVILMFVNAIGFFFTMVLVGMPVALSVPLALFGGFVAAFIPAIGTYLGSAVPIIMTLAIQGLVPALIVLAYTIIYQQIENYWLSPKISSDTMTLNGAVAFGAALAGGAIAGPIGAFVALPVAALITAFVSNFVPKNEVVYEFEYEQHVEAAKEAMESE
ncbi:MAG: AI-2E family transporter [Acidimicrobiia bacterium]|nr:AI-2E family transporter [Acidimicrobiia bacterium]